MRTLKVKNVGPIKEAFLDLKKVNILIGPQSIGKSTLAKLVCNATWIEKEICLNMSADKFKNISHFEENLVIYHKMENFLTEESYIEFHSDVLSFTYSKREFSLHWKDLAKYKRIKTLYIPAERNIIAVIPNWFDVNLERNNTRSYLAHWESVRKFFTKNKPLKLLDIARYYYDPASKSDRLVSGGKSFNIQSASSGLQTLTPMLALVDFYSRIYYSERENDSGREEESLNNVLRMSRLIRRVSTYLERDIKMRNENDNHLWDTIVNYHNTRSKNDTEGDFKDSLMSYFTEMFKPHSTAFFIEEPEQNLYPTAQRDLMNHLIESLSDRDHTVFITTHSPYVLTTVNNMLLAHEVSRANAIDTEAIIPSKRWLDKADVAAWKMDAKNGILEPLLDEELAMLRVEDIDDVSSVINTEFDELFDLQNREEDGE